MWTYRVVKRVREGEVVYGIHEAYDDGDIAQPHSITMEPVGPVAESVEALREVLDRMAAAVGKPVLGYEDVKG
jgi:hypothetical protein